MIHYSRENASQHYHQDNKTRTQKTKKNNITYSSYFILIAMSVYCTHMSNRCTYINTYVPTRTKRTPWSRVALTVHATKFT